MSVLPLRAAALAALALAGCAQRPAQTPALAEVAVPYFDGPIAVVGNLDDPCYRRAPLVADFVIAGAPGRRPPPTAVWLFWAEERLVFAFDCDDATIMAAAPSTQERDVDPQDRVELFLWSGRDRDAYYCLEIAAGGAVHDYSARFYRRFDDAWAPRGWKHAVKSRPGGYRVEAALSHAALEAMGFPLQAGTRIRAGLFRADFFSGKPDSPDWITWVDARTPQPDFHVEGAFGMLVLQPPR